MRKVGVRVWPRWQLFCEKNFSRPPYLIDEFSIEDTKGERIKLVVCDDGEIWDDGVADTLRDGVLPRWCLHNSFVEKNPKNVTLLNDFSSATTGGHSYLSPLVVSNLFLCSLYRAHSKVLDANTHHAQCILLGAILLTEHPWNFSNPQTMNS